MIEAWVALDFLQNESLMCHLEVDSDSSRQSGEDETAEPLCGCAKDFSDGDHGTVSQSLHLLAIARQVEGARASTDTPSRASSAWS